ncbi:acyl-CoA dehydrogenase family protein [Natronolimnohabitans innermongolicus]|uniref:acyl-CoA dehydrogenase family protein n=1 Tax=Natronolimnohabitans innermongolicus TaxID=253107 RepID=UPI000677EB46|nr:acyl-CoA dehydrogenase family protein [Natronolimnohabitans innermongolicus]
MDFSEPDEATRLKSALAEFIETEIRPLEDEHERFFDPDSEREIFDDGFRQVPEYLELKATIRKRAAEAGFWGLNMPESVGGRGVSALTDAIVAEYLADDPPGLHTYAVRGAGADRRRFCSTATNGSANVTSSRSWPGRRRRVSR